MTSPQPIPINSFRPHSSTTASGTQADPGHRPPFNIERQTDSQPRGGRVLGPNELYSGLEAEDGRVIQALRLLKECREQVREASLIDAKSDFIGYDENMMRALGTLRKLFALREIGDGFAATINALIWALQERESDPLTARQFSTVIEVVDQLRRRPKLHFDSSMKLMDQLEDSELDTEPPIFDVLLESEK